MARPPRLQIADGIYHVYSRGNERALIYRGDSDRERFLGEFANVARSHRWCAFAYSLMPNHYHLLFRTLEANLADGMRRLNGAYAQGFNRIHARVGHVFQGRYGARLVRTDDDFLGAVRYVVRNPVRAGLCEGPEDWEWSSHRGVLAGASGCVDEPELLAHFGADPAAAREEYRALMAAPEEPEPERPPLTALLAGAVDLAGLARARDHGYTVREIARAAGVSPATISRRLRPRSDAETRGADPSVAVRNAGV